MIAAQLNIPPSESMSWEWDEILDRYNDAFSLAADQAKFQAKLAGAKVR